jgi:hypothetical protein
VIPNGRQNDAFFGQRPDLSEVMKGSGRLFFIDAGDRKPDVDQNELAHAYFGNEGQAYRLTHAAEIDASRAESGIGARNGQHSSGHSQAHIQVVASCNWMAMSSFAMWVCYYGHSA